MTKLTVIIPTHNRRQALAECLVAVRNQTELPDEILIVDDASSDDTRLWLQTIHDQRLRVVHVPTNVGVAMARNIGAERATGEWLLFLDDDCVPEPSWLKELRRCLMTDGTPVEFGWGRTDYLRAGYRGYFPERLVSNQRGKWPGAGNFAVRRDIFLTVGGFDPSFLQYINEDTEFALRLVSRGHRYRRVPTALVYHQAQLWTTRSLLATYRNAAVWPILKKKYPACWREFRPNIVGGVLLWPMELFILLTFPISIPILFIRYLLNGQRRIGIFFVKYPLLIVMRRLRLWAEAIRQGVLVI